jgi:hypothetical protein
MLRIHARVFDHLSPDEQTHEIVGFGAYLGEVMRRAFGGMWGRVTVDGESFTWLQLGNGTICWPHDHVRKRLLLGQEYDVVRYAAAISRGEPR